MILNAWNGLLAHTIYLHDNPLSQVLSVPSFGGEGTCPPGWAGWEVVTKEPDTEQVLSKGQFLFSFPHLQTSLADTVGQGS